MMTGKVAVIGSGLGGLTSALILARAGLKVTLFERQQTTGGYAVQFKRKGYTFDPALHSVPAGNKGDVFYNLIKDLGLSAQVSFLRMRNGPKVILGNNEYELPNDPNQLYRYLWCCFPQEKENIIRFRAYIEKYSKIYSGILIENKPLYEVLPPFLVKLPVFLYQSYESTDKFLSSFFKSPLLKELLYQYAIFMGIPMDEFPAVNYIMMASMLLTKGMYSIYGGGGGLTNVLTDHFKHAGGILQLGTEITALKICNNKVTSIQDSSGNLYETDAVVANTNLPELIRITPKHCLSDSYIKTVSGLKPSISVVQLHIGLNCDVSEIGIERHLYFYFPQNNVGQCIKHQRESFYPEGFSITAPGITDPHNYKNTKVLSVVGGVNGQKWIALDEKSYREAKEECVKKLVNKLELQFPKIRRHIVVTDLATPRTFERYTGNPGGALMGFNCTCGEHQKLLKVSNFPIENCYIASAWTDKLGGFLQSMRAGQTAANRVIKRLKKKR